MMIELSNGHKMEYVVASGALGFDGKGYPWEWPFRWVGLLDPTLFTVFIKTLTRHPRKGNLRWWKPWGCIRNIPFGAVNAVGLTNPGINWWCERIGPKVERSGIALAGSILADNLNDLGYMAARLGDFPLVAIEFNGSCPNTDEEALKNGEFIVRGCERIKNACDLPLIVKLSAMHNEEWILPRIQGMAEGISINSVPWRLACTHDSSPLAHLGGGGVSGKPAQLQNWNVVVRIVRYSNIPAIASSIWHYEDIPNVRRLGAKAVSFDAIHLPRFRKPFAPLNFLKPTRYVRRELREKRKKLCGEAAERSFP